MEGGLFCQVSNGSAHLFPPADGEERKMPLFFPSWQKGGWSSNSPVGGGGGGGRTVVTRHTKNATKKGERERKREGGETKRATTSKHTRTHKSPFPPLPTIEENTVSFEWEEAEKKLLLDFDISPQPPILPFRPLPPPPIEMAFSLRVFLLRFSSPKKFRRK